MKDYYKYIDLLTRHISKKVGNREDVRDLVQETLLKSVRFAGYYNPEIAAYEAWLTAIASNCIIDYYRERQTRYSSHNHVLEADILPFDERGLVPKASDETDRPAFINQLKTILAKKLTDLRFEERQVIELYFFDQLKYREIAEKLHMNINTAKVTLMRAKENLKSKLKNTELCDIYS